MVVDLLSKSEPLSSFKVLGLNFCIPKGEWWSGCARDPKAPTMLTKRRLLVNALYIVRLLDAYEVFFY
jgi:hypothetical protein